MTSSGETPGSPTLWHKTVSNVVNGYYTIKGYFTNAISIDQLEHEATVFINGKSYEFNRNSKELSYAIKDRCCSLMWFTYRKDFAAIPGSWYTSDTGWGCMLRAGQMLLAEGFVRHRLGAGFTLASAEGNTAVYEDIASWFQDCATKPYSIHNIARTGVQWNLKVGSWFGPSSISSVLQSLVNANSSAFHNNELCVYLAQDTTVCIDSVVKLCSAHHKPHAHSNPNPLQNGQTTTTATGTPTTPATQQSTIEEFTKSVIILIPVKLGMDNTINPVYYDSIKKCFKIKHFIGMVGGKPKAALYFFGTQANNMLYLDPHIVQPAWVPTVATSRGKIHPDTIHTMQMSQMDPACVLSFYCRNRKDFDECLQLLQTDLINNNPAPPFSVIQKEFQVDGFSESGSVCESVSSTSEDNSSKGGDTTNQAFNASATTLAAHKSTPTTTPNNVGINGTDGPINGAAEDSSDEWEDLST